MEPILSLRAVSKIFTLHQQNKQISGCTDVNFNLHKGEFIGITGKSGSGKSTILKCIYRTYLTSSGSILFNSNSFGMLDLTLASEQQIIQIRSNEIGYVSQFLKVLPRVTAIDVVIEALLEQGTEAEDAVIEAEVMLRHFQLPEHLWDTYPNTFSGGEKLRLNLARAMVKRPRMLLLDEPTASLDRNSKEAVREMIYNLKSEGTSMIGIFHDLDFMQQVVDSHYQMAFGQLKKGLEDKEVLR